MVLSAAQVDVYKTKMVAVGKAHVHYVDPATKTSLDADAEKIVVTTMTLPAPKGAKNAKAVTAVKSATISGPTKMIYTFVDPKYGPSKATATADDADYDGTTHLMHLVGNVTIVSENTALLAEPATMTGDKATVNLMPGPEDFRFRIESAPGLSTITATPKPKETGK